MAASVLIIAIITPNLSEQSVRNQGVKKPASSAELIKLLFSQPSKIYPLGEHNEKTIKQWIMTYSEGNLEYEKKVMRFRFNNDRELITSYQQLIKGWKEMIDSGHLRMIHDLCVKFNVPFDIVFLALTESAWRKTANSSAGARGYWQFMSSTAKLYGLAVDSKKGVDERLDPVKSTKAAIFLLRDNFKLTYGWDELYNINSKKIPASARWQWAFWSYNKTPKLVSKYYGKLRGNPHQYPLYADNEESANYVNKIFAIKQVIKEYVKSENEKLKLINSKRGKTDTLIEQYIKNWHNLELFDRQKALINIQEAYSKQYKNKAPDDIRKIYSAIEREKTYVDELVGELNKFGYTISSK
ncbi:Lytic transglycosylase-like, catalytic domain protein [Candidatus Magnetoovum chiemensis]|nr:Lytic transglycosylase-like, catalytic domain protein [Candidatus Magnetoovum chiemensis]